MTFLSFAINFELRDWNLQNLKETKILQRNFSYFKENKIFRNLTKVDEFIVDYINILWNFVKFHWFLLICTLGICNVVLHRPLDKISAIFCYDPYHNLAVNFERFFEILQRNFSYIKENKFFWNLTKVDEFIVYHLQNFWNFVKFHLIFINPHIRNP